MSAAGSGLSPLEVAAGIVFGVEPAAGEEPRPPRPLELLGRSVTRALRRPPCLVSFSGGRDSSCVLALAADVARRDGLPLPIPATLRFPSLPESDESDWQERVVSSLRLEDWIRIEPGARLDAVGPVATGVLRRFGLLWPFNAYVHQPLLEAARGGSLLTGVGGDELLEHMTVDRPHVLLARRARPVPRDLARLGLWVAPGSLRRAVLRRRDPLRLSWLTARALGEANRLWAEEAAGEPRRLSARAAWWTRRRALRVAVRSLGQLGEAEGVSLEHPLAEPELASALLADRELAFASRAERLEAIFGGLVPVGVYRRRSKASFNRALFGPHARELASRWCGEHVDSTLVDRDALRRVWQEEVPDGRTFLLLQSIWLADATRASPGAAPSPLRATSTPAVSEARTPAEP